MKSMQKVGRSCDNCIGASVPLKSGCLEAARAREPDRDGGEIELILIALKPWKVVNLRRRYSHALCDFTLPLSKSLFDFKMPRDSEIL